MTFLPFVDEECSAELKASISRLGPVLITPATIPVWRPRQYIVLLDQGTDIDQATQILDNGALQIVVPVAVAKDLIDHLPRQRLLLLLDARNVSAVSDRVRDGVSGVILQTASPDLELVSSIKKFFGQEQNVRIWPSSQSNLSTVREISRQSSGLVIPTSSVCLSSGTDAKMNLAELFLAPVTSDRPDGLFPTIVSSFSNGGKTLGLVYSSKESVEKAIATGQGWYQSRKHGLWRKGETSGATQEVISIRADCDSDALEFQVVQEGPGFCHNNTPSCFGAINGLAQLERTLLERKKSAPPGSYTQRLFDDSALLRAKILEEAEELASATTKKDVAFEAADLFYFALARCVSAGVSLTDVEASLDAKSLKVTRRPGNAKPKYAAEATPSSKASTSQVSSRTSIAQEADAAIRMRHANLVNATPAERLELLRRPVLKSNEMIAKVKPIIDGVRSGGDKSLKEFTSKFDKVDLEQNILRAPFPAAAMQLESSVRDAIACAYDNVRKFHAAQMEDKPLVVETMPGVVCSRFARPIARVGLYVPGGTAILPSTALMLGVPAQVAGCKEIVIAVPPRPDGSISPEVLFVAHLVGASAVLKAGGAQAIAAMAYGTETVPKVDKIFGPGNQWVTAAKMAVQNDTDALVSIDMPAGPSEVLVRWLSLSRPRNSGLTHSRLLQIIPPSQPSWRRICYHRRSMESIRRSCLSPSVWTRKSLRRSRGK